MLNKIGLQNAKSCKTSMCTWKKLVKSIENFEEGNSLQKHDSTTSICHFHKARHSLWVSKSSQYIEQPLKLYWIACKRILRYLKGTQMGGLLFKLGDVKSLINFTDANWDAIFRWGKTHTWILCLLCRESDLMKI